MKKQDCFYLGKIVSKFSFKGEILLKLDSDEIDFKKLKTIFLDIDGTIVPYSIDNIKLHKSSLLRIRFENIDKDFESFLEKYNLTNFYKTHKRILERKNSTNHDDYKKYLCPSSKSIIERIWGEDFYIKTNI